MAKNPSSQQIVLLDDQDDIYANYCKGVAYSYTTVPKSGVCSYSGNGYIVFRDDNDGIFLKVYGLVLTVSSFLFPCF
jgi:hypothetical protein